MSDRRDWIPTQQPLLPQDKISHPGAGPHWPQEAPARSRIQLSAQNDLHAACPDLALVSGSPDCLGSGGCRSLLLGGSEEGFRALSLPGLSNS